MGDQVPPELPLFIAEGQHVNMFAPAGTLARDLFVGLLIVGV